MSEMPYVEEEYLPIQEMQHDEEHYVEEGIQ